MIPLDTLSLPLIVLATAAISCVVLAGASLLGRWHTRLQWSFAAGMAGLAIESGIGVMISTTETAADRLVWLRAMQISSLLLLLPWILFVITLVQPDWSKIPRSWRMGVIAAGGLVLAGCVVSATLPGFQVADMSAPFYAVRIDPNGQFAFIAQLLTTVALLGGLEVCLRTASRNTRWKLKYLLLGLSGIFLVRFYFLSQTLLFHVLMAAYLTTQAAATVVGNVVIAASLARDRLASAQVTVSPQMFYRSLLVGTLGAYLLAVGGLGWLLNNLGIPEELLWGSLVVFVAVLGLAVILLSENVRWRIRRFLALHFYRAKYDYRDQWIKFSARMGSLPDVRHLAYQVLTAVTDAVGTAKGALYLLDSFDNAYHLTAAVEVTNAPPRLEQSSPVISRLRRERRPVSLEENQGIVAPFVPGGLGVPLLWRETLIGILLVGPERAGAPYGTEDWEFLDAVGKQAAAAIMTTQLSESLAQARELEAFNRLTSFVVHDLKNSISALSMLAGNALKNFDDPEFQRDALTTLSRTVDRMQRLLTRLTSVKDVSRLHRQPIDPAPLMADMAALRVRGTKIRLVDELKPVPPILADPDAIELVLQNLINNAIDAMDGDGQLTVRTEARNGEVIVAVSDTGCGMSAEFIRTSLFMPFKSSKKRGWGIGLYQAREIVAAHGGRIEVESEEGRGTTFRLIFQAMDANPSVVSAR